jgi:hypothetical protein
MNSDPTKDTPVVEVRSKENVANPGTAAITRESKEDPHRLITAVQTAFVGTNLVKGPIGLSIMY